MAAAVSISWTTYAWEDYLYWQAADEAILSKINDLLKECLRTPFTGRGKPEPLKGGRKGFWSRRITPRASASVQAQRRHALHCAMPLSL